MSHLRSNSLVLRGIYLDPIQIYFTTGTDANDIRPCYMDIFVKLVSANLVFRCNDELAITTVRRFHLISCCCGIHSKQHRYSLAALKTKFFCVGFCVIFLPSFTVLQIFPCYTFFIQSNIYFPCIIVPYFAANTLCYLCNFPCKVTYISIQSTILCCKHLMLNRKYLSLDQRRPNLFSLV